MAGYIELQITVTDKALREILIAQLAAIGIAGFEEEKNLLKAFAEADGYDESLSKEIIEQNGLKYSISTIEDKNWNAEWESGFSPVVIGHFCAIRASFHEAISGVKHDIIITPKMSFGTGHHASTHLMVEAIASLDLKDKQVFDFGTGTGVLAILAEQCGAKSIRAIDNDPWSIINAEENFNSNNCHKILLNNGNGVPENEFYDVIFANINRNIILQHMVHLKQHLAANGVLLLSGLLTGDESIITEEALKYQLQLAQRTEMNGWICLRMVNAQ